MQSHSWRRTITRNERSWNGLSVVAAALRERREIRA